MKLKGILERFMLTTLTFLLFAFLRDRLGLVQVEDYLTLIVILLLLYFVINPLLLWFFNVVRNQYNRLVPKIGILNGYIADASREHKCVPKHTKIAGIVWERELREDRDSAPNQGNRQTDQPTRLQALQPDRRRDSYC